MNQSLNSQVVPVLDLQGRTINVWSSCGITYSVPAVHLKIQKFMFLHLVFSRIKALLCFILLIHLVIKQTPELFTLKRFQEQFSTFSCICCAKQTNNGSTSPNQCNIIRCFYGGLSFGSQQHFKRCKRNAVVYCSLYDLEVQIICLCSDQRYCPNKSPDLGLFFNL